MTTELPTSTQEYLNNVKKAIATPSTGLGHLARRYEAAVRDLQEAVGKYGQSVVLGKVAGHDFEVPVSASFTVRLDLAIGDKSPQSFEVKVGPASSVIARPEKPFSAFGSKPVAQVINST